MTLILFHIPLLSEVFTLQALFLYMYSLPTISSLVTSALFPGSLIFMTLICVAVYAMFVLYLIFFMIPISSLVASAVWPVVRAVVAAHAVYPLTMMKPGKSYQRRSPPILHQVKKPRKLTGMSC